MQASPFTGYKANRSDETIHMNEIRLVHEIALLANKWFVPYITCLTLNFRIILAYLLAQKSKSDLVVRENGLVNFIEYIFADRRDILANAIDDNDKMLALVKELTQELSAFLKGQIEAANRSILESIMKQFLKRVETASMMVTEKIKYKVTDHYRWFDREPVKPRENSFCHDWRLKMIITYAASRPDVFIPSFVSLSMGIIKYQSELVWRLSEPQHDQFCLKFIDMLAVPLRGRIYEQLSMCLVNDDINLFSLECHFPRLKRLLPSDVLPVTARHLTPRFLNSAELLIYNHHIARRIDRKDELVDQLLTDYAQRCNALGKNHLFCANIPSGLDKCFMIGQHYYEIIKPLIGQTFKRLPMCANAAILSQFYQSRHQLRLDWTKTPFWRKTMNTLIDQLVELSTSIQDKDLSHNVCEHICRILRLCWDLERFFAADEIRNALDDIIVKLISNFGSKRHFREACAKFFSDLMRQMYNI